MTIHTTIRGSGDKYPSYPSGVAAQLGYLPRFGLLGTNIRVIQAEWPHNSVICHDSGFWGQIWELSKRSGRTTRLFATIRGAGGQNFRYSRARAHTFANFVQIWGCGGQNSRYSKPRAHTFAIFVQIWGCGGQNLRYSKPRALHLDTRPAPVHFKSRRRGLSHFETAPCCFFAR